MIIDLRMLARQLIMNVLSFLPRNRQTKIERWLRGREDCRKLALADFVVVSFGKSGRTWLRVMLSRFYQVRYGLEERHLLAFDNLHAKSPAIPRILFTHDNYLADYNKNIDKSHYYNKKVILLVRDPADVAVSQYHQWKYRMSARKRRINDYPLDGETPLYDFVIRRHSGLPKVIDFLNQWARELPRMRSILVVRYEDMRADPAKVLARILDFLGSPGTPDEIRLSVEFASVENMRKLEERRVFWLSGRRMLATDRSNPNTYKVRRAKVGGYRDDFTAEQLAVIDTMMATDVLAAFGYRREATAAGGVRP